MVSFLNHSPVVFLRCFVSRGWGCKVTRPTLPKSLEWLNSFFNAPAVSKNSLNKSLCSRNNGISSKNVY